METSLQESAQGIDGAVTAEGRGAGDLLAVLVAEACWAAVLRAVVRYAHLASGQLRDAAAVIDQGPDESDSENSV